MVGVFDIELFRPAGVVPCLVRADGTLPRDGRFASRHSGLTTSDDVRHANGGSVIFPAQPDFRHQLRRLCCRSSENVVF